MTKPIHKTVQLDLEGYDGNAFALLGAFKKQAQQEGWTAQEISTVIEQAKQGDYNHLLNTLISYCDAHSQAATLQYELFWDDLNAEAQEKLRPLLEARSLLTIQAIISAEEE